MRVHEKIFLVSVGILAIFLTASWAYLRHIEYSIAELEMACSAENDRRIAEVVTPKGTSNDKIQFLLYEQLTCIAEMVVEQPGLIRSQVQLDLADAQRRMDALEKRSDFMEVFLDFVVAAFLVFLGTGVLTLSTRLALLIEWIRSRIWQRGTHI